MTPPIRSPIWQAVQLAWEFGYLIVIPLVAFALGGRWLDRLLGTSPWMLLGGMGLAVSTTTVFLVRKFSRLIKDSAASSPNKSTSNHTHD